MNARIPSVMLAVVLMGCGDKNRNDDEDTATDAVEDTTATDTAGDTAADPTEDDTAGDTVVDPVADPTEDPSEDVLVDGEEDAHMDVLDATDVVDADDGHDATDMAGDDSSGPALAFSNIACLPDIHGGADWVEGQSITCAFEVHGEVGRDATLSCEDTGGTSLDCSSSSSTQIQPFGSNPLPITSGWFGAPSTGLAGTTYEIVWVADDGTDQARYTLSGSVIADDGVDGDPSILVDCGGDADGEVDVTAGDRLECTLTFLDPDPDSIWWDYSLDSGATPVNEPSPYSGLGGAPYSVLWHWDTDVSESGGTWVWTFTADDETDPVISFDLTVHVL